MEYNVNCYIKEYIENNINNIEYNINDIYIVIANFLNISKDKLYLEKNNIVLTTFQRQELDKLLNKMYKENIPLQYITHMQSFFYEQYFVNEDVLIPRQDTEILVEKAIEYINKYNLNTVLDMCTGSGCIGISILNNSNIKEATLVDISNKALKVAKKNLSLNNVTKKVNIVESDLFKNIKDIKYDILVSNPPYIKTDIISSLEKSVQKEPYIALNGGINGLDVYIRILKEAKNFLNNNAIIILEIGYDQLNDILSLLSSHNEYEVLENVKDLGNNDRVVVCRFHQI